MYKDIRYEQACVLYNIGCLYAQLASRESRQTDEVSLVMKIQIEITERWADINEWRIHSLTFFLDSCLIKCIEVKYKNSRKMFFLEFKDCSATLSIFSWSFSIFKGDITNLFYSIWAY